MAPTSLWRSVAIAGAVCVGVFIATIIGFGVWLARNHTSAQFVDTYVAQAQFDAVHAQVAGTQPLVEIRTGGGTRDAVVHRNPGAPPRAIAALHVLSYDPRVRKLARVELPGWVLQWVSVHGTIRLANLELFDDDRDRLTLEDLERHGPGLVLEIAGPPHVLIWTE